LRHLALLMSTGPSGAGSGSDVSHRRGSGRPMGSLMPRRTSHWAHLKRTL